MYGGRVGKQRQRVRTHKKYAPDDLDGGPGQVEGGEPGGALRRGEGGLQRKDVEPAAEALRDMWMWSWVWEDVFFGVKAMYWESIDRVMNE